MALPPSSSPSTHSQVVTDLLDVYYFARGFGDQNYVWPTTLRGAYARPGGTAIDVSNDRFSPTAVSLIRGCTISAITVEITTAAAGGLARGLIYDTDDYGWPKNLIADCGTAAADTTGTKTITLSTPLVISRPSMIWVGALVAATSATSLVNMRGLKTSSINNLGNRGPVGDNLPRGGQVFYNTTAGAVLTDFQSGTWGVSSNVGTANVGLVFSAVNT